MKFHRPVLILAFFLFLPALLSSQESKIDRTVFNLPRGEIANLPFSDAVMVRNTLYISGRGGIDLRTMKVPADPKEEAKLLLDGFKAILEKGDMTMDNLISVTVYCSDLSLYGQFNEVYRTYFSRYFPARAFVGSGPLLFGMHFEMQGIAAK